MEFYIHVTTLTNQDYSCRSCNQSIPDESFDAFVSGLFEQMGKSGLKLTDEDGDAILIPKEVINNSIVQVIKTNN